MDFPDGYMTKYMEKITIPSAFIQKGLGEALKKVISVGEMVNVNLAYNYI